MKLQLIVVETGERWKRALFRMVLDPKTHNEYGTISNNNNEQHQQQQQQQQDKQDNVIITIQDNINKQQDNNYKNKSIENKRLRMNDLHHQREPLLNNYNDNDNDNDDEIISDLDDSSSDHDNHHQLQLNDNNCLCLCTCSDQDNDDHNIIINNDDDDHINIINKQQQHNKHNNVIKCKQCCSHNYKQHNYHHNKYKKGNSSGDNGSGSGNIGTSTSTSTTGTSLLKLNNNKNNWLTSTAKSLFSSINETKNNTTTTTRSRSNKLNKSKSTTIQQQQQQQQQSIDNDDNKYNKYNNLNSTNLLLPTFNKLSNNIHNNNNNNNNNGGGAGTGTQGSKHNSTNNYLISSTNNVNDQDNDHHQDNDDDSNTIIKIDMPSPIRTSNTSNLINNNNNGTGSNSGNDSCLLTTSITTRRTRYPKEIYKTCIAALIMIVNFILTTISLALVHERVPDRTQYGPLPDIVLDNIEAHDWALAVSEVIIMLLFNLTIILLIFHKHRFIVFRRLFLILSLLYLMRSITMYVTVLPISSKTYYCSPKLTTINNNNTTTTTTTTDNNKTLIILERVIQLISGFGLSINGKHTYCGDYIYSGHTVCLVLSYLFIIEYSPKRFYIIHWLTFILAMCGVVMVLIAHGHYTVDVIIAYYITTRLFWLYHTLCNNIIFKNSSTNNYIGKEWWFPLFKYFECNVGGVVPRQYNWPLPWPKRCLSKHPQRTS
ncbi:phosphatidylcholine:ceramide cholinephosphotransferase 1-like [Chrysoperla carnea]|uniref:phosphatidylcholine:ceramide cholinephosphotransferase 1-like n=1 Tax=Chrysoperla carnea TaxID=189513 RepID=UPI001D0934A3|nr:phosphatidylcholine:ceramide cholinephosphotransferase 1-like [Chrysoperla carnea]